jgi:hypothetical protein
VVHQLFVDFKKAYDSVRRQVLHNILTDFGVFLKVVRLIKMCINETYSRVRVGKHLSEALVIAGKEICLEVNAEKTKYMVMF